MQIQSCKTGSQTQKQHHIEYATAVNRHKAVMEGTKHREEKLSALNTNMLQADRRRLEGTMAQVHQVADAHAAQTPVTQLKRDLNEFNQTYYRQRL